MGDRDPRITTNHSITDGFGPTNSEYVICASPQKLKIYLGIS